MDFKSQKDSVIKLYSAVIQKLTTLKDINSRKELSDFDLEIMLHLVKDLYIQLEFLRNTNEIDNKLKNKNQQTTTSVQTKFSELKPVVRNEISETEIKPSTLPTDDASLDFLVEQVKKKTRTEVITPSEPKRIEPGFENTDSEKSVSFEQPKEPKLEPQPQIEVKTDSLTVEQSEKQSEKREIEELKNKILYDKFQKSGTSVNERLTQEQSDDSIGQKISTNPVVDIKKSIGINDRFTFINELFSGSKIEFDSFIEQVISGDSKEKVLHLVENTSTIRNWDKSKMAYFSFISLIERYLLSK